MYVRPEPISPQKCIRDKSFVFEEKIWKKCSDALSYLGKYFSFCLNEREDNLSGFLAKAFEDVHNLETVSKTLVPFTDHLYCPTCSATKY